MKIKFKILKTEEYEYLLNIMRTSQLITVKLGSFLLVYLLTLHFVHISDGGHMDEVL